MRADARRFENWETNEAAKIGLGAAVDYALGGARRHLRLGHGGRRRPCAGGWTVPGVVSTTPAIGSAAIVTFTIVGGHAYVPGRRAARGRQRLGVDHRVRATTPKPAGLPDLARASPHYFDTDDELDRLVERVEGISRS